MTKPFTQINLAGLSALRGLSGSSTIVYLALRIYGGKDGSAWPSQERVSQDLDMPVPTVRKSFAQLRKMGLITQMKDAKSKTATYQIIDVNISNMVCQENKEDTKTDISTDQNGYLDISDLVSTNTETDIQIDKVKDKENIHLINKASTPAKEVEVQNNKNTIRGSIDRLSRLDLLFLEFWNLYQMRHGMQAAGGNPIDEWRTATAGCNDNQIERGLKGMDLLMRENPAPWRALSGKKWIARMNRWFRENADTALTSYEHQKYAGGLEVNLRDLEEYRQEQMQAEEINERAQAIAIDPTTDARMLWIGFNQNNDKYEDLFNAVRAWKDEYLTEQLLLQIQADDALSEFYTIISI